ncbi:Silent information regulator protein Sir2 [Planoprotostelium fungivorum]|uniref:Silent information regulator protein Sir2 n=1 Tax=Planoprotostelium fungivorum TaxID=1890364 RepID=A0A2P6NJJ7_9EUKA|nr:Silent information regulator protein Sir2 [Planoprotostelium fungivorum]
MSDRYREAARSIQEADAILVTAGAGMGVDSGLPDFRGQEGFWKAYPMAQRLGLRFEQLANPMGFYGHRLNLYRQTIPHQGFHILRDIIRTKEKGGFVFTTNVDGQFQRAGFEDDRIVEIHGSIDHLQCTNGNDCPGTGSITRLDDAIRITINEENLEADLTSVPKCPHAKCGSMMRPNILMFNDWQWQSDRTDDQNEEFKSWLKHLQINDKRITVIDIGSGTAIPTARRKAESVARDFDGTLIRINPREPEIPSGVRGFSFSCGAVEALTRMKEMMIV